MNNRLMAASALVAVIAVHAYGVVDDVGRYATRFGDTASGALPWVFRDIRLFFASDAYKLADRISIRYATPFAFAERNVNRLAAEVGSSVTWVDTNLDDAIKTMTAGTDGIDDAAGRLDLVTTASLFDVRELVKSTVCETADQLLESRWDPGSEPRVDIRKIVVAYIKGRLLSPFGGNVEIVVGALEGVPAILASEAKSAADRDVGPSPGSTRIRLYVLARCLGL